MTQMTKKELMQTVQSAAAVIKLTCGVGNNASWLCCLDALDRLKLHRDWRKNVRGGGTVGSLYKRAINAFHRYEQALVWADSNRCFHVADMPEATRRTYAAALTDREYYDMWATIGGIAYQKTRPLITSLQNKYRLSLEAHGVPQADIAAWSMAAQACLDTAGMIYDRAIANAAAGSTRPEALFRNIFKGFDIRPVAKLWRDALMATAPEIVTYNLSGTESRNIDHGLEQLAEAWIDLHTLYDSVADTIADYGEVFRTKGFQKRALCAVADARNEISKTMEAEP